MKPGDWVHFWTRNWPEGTKVIQFSIDKPSESEDVARQGLYSGRGRIVRIRDTGAMLIREDRSKRLVEVASGERVEPMARDYHTLTLGDLRRFLEDHKQVPDDTTVCVSLPVEFNCDDEALDLEDGHPEQHDPNAYEDVTASGITFTAIEKESGDIADGYIPPAEWGPGEEWFFTISIIPHGREAHDALRGDDHE